MDLDKSVKDAIYSQGSDAFLDRIYSTSRDYCNDLDTRFELPGWKTRARAKSSDNKKLSGAAAGCKHTKYK